MLPKLFKKNNYKSAFDKKLLKEYFKNQNGSLKNSFCKAPLVSMDFATNGMVIPCCLNHSYIYGKYPEDSLHEIWFGDKVKIFCKKLSEMDLSQGCFLCEQDLLKKNFDLIYSKTYSYFQENVISNYPLNMGFALDNTCNLSCQMCSGENSSTYRSEIEHRAPFDNPYDTNFVLQLEEFIPFLQRVVFAGGEPFLTDIYYEIWERIIAINPKIEIVICTNGTVLNQRIKDLIDKGLFYFAVSMDSLKKENFEKIRVKAKFEQFMENLNYFHEYSKRNNRWMTLSVCPMQQNWHDIPDLLRMANDRNLNFYFNNVYFPYYSTLRSLPADEIKKIIDYFNLQTYPNEINAVVYSQNMYLYHNFMNVLNSWKNDAENRHDAFPMDRIEKMKEMLILRLKEEITNQNNWSESEKKEKIIKHTSMCQKLFLAFDGNDDILSRAIYHIANLPQEIFYGEMETSDLERLIGRFNQSGT